MKTNNLIYLFISFAFVNSYFVNSSNMAYANEFTQYTNLTIFKCHTNQEKLTALFTIETPSTPDLEIIEFGTKDADKFTRWTNAQEQSYNAVKRCESVLSRFEYFYNCNYRLLNEIQPSFYTSADKSYYPILIIPNSKLGMCKLKHEGHNQNISEGSLLFMLPPQNSEELAINEAKAAINNLTVIRLDGGSSPFENPIKN